MKRILNKLKRDEKGQALLIVLILLVVGGLIIGPLLGFMSTGLIVGQAYEWRMDELYAADSGVEDALWQIMTIPDELPRAEGELDMNYNIANVNDKVVNPIIIEYIDEKTYRIESTATSTDTGSSTTIESYINIISFANFMDNAITSMNDVTIQPGSTVIGTVQYNGVLDDEPGDLIPDENEITDPIEGWPTAEPLHDYYWPDVADLEETPYPDAEIDLKDTTTIPRLYRVGDLTITNKGISGAIGTLEGGPYEGTVIYVTGNLEFQQTGNKDYVIDLNYSTIFVLGEIDFPSDRCTLNGPGCIIAVGDINFQPSMTSDPNDFIFVMSVDGTVNFQPSGDFYGSLAGNINVNLQPGSSLIWNGPPPELKYPGAEPSEKNVISSILTWEISLQ